MWTKFLTGCFLFAPKDDGGSGDVDPAPEPTTPPDPPAQPPADPPVTTTSEDGGNNPAWLPDRLQRAERAAVNRLLSDVGVTDVDELKSIFQAARELEDAQKTELQKATDQLNKLKPKAERVSTLEAAFQNMLEQELENVDEGLRASVDAMLETIPTPEGKYTALRNWRLTIAQIAAQQQQSTTTGKPQAPNLNARDGVPPTSEGVDVPDEYLTMAKRLGWSEEETEKYRPRG